MKRATTCTLGLDIGSTTAKAVLRSSDGEIIDAIYQRHGAAVRQTLAAILADLSQRHPGLEVRGAITGSGALSISDVLGLPFLQEVMAAARALMAVAPQTDVAIELGGEDAKILCLSQGMELRMNETCAGGTGAFIDQMAALLQTDAPGLNALAEGHTTLYPIASRCGVFAKTDIVPLINEGARREDIAASIFQAVVDQTIGGLACGISLKGKIAFLGGPLHFLSELKKRFVETLGLSDEDVVCPPDAQFTVALGAAIEAGAEVHSLEDLARRAAQSARETPVEAPPLPPFFETEMQRASFEERHARQLAKKRDLAGYRGEAFLGIDIGSTTVKAVLLSDAGELLHSWYERNRGAPLEVIRRSLAALLEKLPEGVVIRRAAATGYGADLAQVAFGIDLAEVETVAHCRAACELVPDATYVLDIGGQDMKCLKVRDRRIVGIALNEACSAGCGAFLETFAESLGLPLRDFVESALVSRRPTDLGSRCTVFMNSKVKQAQKEGAAIGDIAAGLCYSVARNALYKVLRIRDPEELGNRVIVQGGAFANDALLCAMEWLLGRPLIRPEISGLMGAFGAALLARDEVRLANTKGSDLPASRLLSLDELRALSATSKTQRCQGCGNRCLLTINRFSDGRRFISGNRCEKGAGKKLELTNRPPNLYAWKNKRLFDYEPRPLERAPRGEIGIPRVLNQFESFPFWFTLFDALGFRVTLSSPSSKALYDLGLSSMPSQTVCFPAKLAHGHIADLLRRGVKTIFYPTVPRETKEHPSARDCFNCPVVSGYPEVIRLNTEALAEEGVRYFSPCVNPAHAKSLARILSPLFQIPERELLSAIEKARRELERYRAELRREGERALAWVREKRGHGIVFAGRPYHVDPLVNHGLDELVVSLGAALISEDSIAHLQADMPELDIVNQWTYHARLYRTAALVGRLPNVDFVQLTSFGCGVDAVTADEAHRILDGAGKLHTLIKIDEGGNLGPARIRIRSLMAAVRGGQLGGVQVEDGEDREAGSRAGTGESMPATYLANTRGRVPFVTRMRRTHTILAPQMMPLHFDLYEGAFRASGYRFDILPKVDRAAIELGLKYVHNDACYPALVVIGQQLQALTRGDYDPDTTAMLLTQTCGPCRATNYIPLLRKALVEAGYPQVPVLSLNSGRGDQQPGFEVTLRFAERLLLAGLYGDMLMRLSNATRPYEVRKGETDALTALWLRRARSNVESPGTRIDVFRRHLGQMVRDFEAIPRDGKIRPRVGVVGEILLKYHPDANNNAVRVIEQEGGEAVVTDFNDFLLYCLSDAVYQGRHHGGSVAAQLSNRLSVGVLEGLRDALREALEGTRYMPVAHIDDLERKAAQVITTGLQAGEGWLLTADMLELIDHGAPNVLCLQPFGCLPNHITGKGVIKEIKRVRPNANIAAIDYDPGACESNQINRIKLFMSVAHERLAETLGESNGKSTVAAIDADLGASAKPRRASKSSERGTADESLLAG